MPQLENIIIDLAKKNEINPDFRFFLTSMLVTYFPVSILQNGIKLTT
jgi:dynein heavy chain, axonemal